LGEVPPIKNPVFLERALFNEEISMSVNMTQMSSNITSASLGNASPLGAQGGSQAQSAPTFPPDGGGSQGSQQGGGGNIMQDLMKLLQDVMQMCQGGGGGGGGGGGADGGGIPMMGG
jgi:hypothetical protein